MLNKTDFSYLLPKLICVLFAALIIKGHAQVGLGAKGVLNYPGVLKSQKSDIQFDAGVGYGFFVRHDVYSAESWNLDFRYSAVISKHYADLPRSGETKYEFSNFSVDFIARFLNENLKGLYSGVSLNLLSAVSSNKYINDYSAESIFPAFIFGWGYKWAEGFDLFIELNVGFGSTEAGPEIIPITGPALHSGITMYLSE